MISPDTGLEPAFGIRLRLRPAIELSDEDFFALCQANRDLRFERNADGDVLIMSPTGMATGRRGARITAQLVHWADRDGGGQAFDSSTGFTLPDGSVRSPDAAWVLEERYAALTDHQRERFAPLCPDFVIELRSPSDRLDALQAKMRAYLANGARLGWLLVPEARRVHVYRPGLPPTILEDASEVSGDPELPGFTLDLQPIWR